MLDFLSLYSTEKVTSAIYFAIRALRHLKGIQLDNLKSEISIEEKDLGTKIVNEISEQEGKLLSELNDDTVDKFVLVLYNYLEERMKKTKKSSGGRELDLLRQWRNESVHNYKSPEVSLRPRSKVFLASDINSELGHILRDFILRLDLELQEPQNYLYSGTTSVQQFLEFSALVDIAIFAFSKDHGKRIRDNAVFELGYLLGKLGRNRVIAVVEEGVQMPSDLMGIMYLKTSPNSDSWKFELARQLDYNGLNFDKSALN